MSYKIPNNGSVSADGVFTICDSKGDSFSVKTADGVRAEMIVAFDTSGTMFHSGLVFDNNSFIIKDSDGLKVETKAIMAHRWSDCVEVFPGTKAAFIRKLKSCLGASEKIAQFELGEKVIVAEKYADDLNKDLKATFKIKLKDPNTETNCIRFCQRAVSIGFDNIPPGALEKAFKENGVNRDAARQIDHIWHICKMATAGPFERDADYWQEFMGAQPARGLAEGAPGYHIEDSLTHFNANLDEDGTRNMQERFRSAMQQASNEAMGTAVNMTGASASQRECIIM